MELCTVGCVRGTFEVKSSPCELLGQVCRGNGVVVGGELRETMDAAVDGGFFVWEMFEKEWLERKVGVRPKKLQLGVEALESGRNWKVKHEDRVSCECK